jgi:uncharacterized phage protein (TIGR01671 family)
MTTMINNKDRFKFRAWDGKVMSYQDENGFFYPNLDTSTYKNQIIGLNIALNDTNIIVMQCTGLKDADNKLIFEGDVSESLLHDSNSKKIVVFDRCSFCIKYIDKRETKISEYNISESTTRHLKVVGNIYENPTLNF